MKNLFLLFLAAIFLLPQAKAQPGACVFKQPLITINFGAGENVREINSARLTNYRRLSYSCPYDGSYAYTSYSADCFNGDWFTLAEDHTPGDADGNMMLVNASYEGGVFFHAPMTGLKGGATYEFAVWMMNVCRISDKCPFPLLPNITIRLTTPSGKTVAQLATGQLPRRQAPHWTQYRALFAMPAGETSFTVTMQDQMPGGCGNDFVLDDITIRECVKTTPVVVKKTVPPAAKQQTPAPKPVVKKEIPKQTPVKPAVRTNRIETAEKTLPVQNNNPAPKQKTVVFAPPPAILVSRANPVVKQIKTEAGEMKIDLYDNGEIDDDTVSIYHNNELLVSNARLSQKPISFRISLDPAHPYHELVMVAKNLGSIPPNTSLMIVTANGNRHQVFISSTEQKNAKVVINLKQ